MTSKRNLDNNKRSIQKITKVRTDQGIVNFRHGIHRRTGDGEYNLRDDAGSKEESDSFSFHNWIEPLVGRVEEPQLCLPEISDSVLLKIFQYLNCIDLVSLSRTCKRFGKISRDPNLWRNIDFEITGRSHEIGDDVVCTALSKASTVLKLNMGGCTTISNDVISALLQHQSKLLGLEFISFKSCVRIDIPMLIQFFKTPRWLSVVNLSFCWKVNDPLIQVMASNNDQLQEIHLNECTGITDKALCSIAQFCRSLKVLCLYNCQQITDYGLQQIEFNCGSIEVLDIGKCSRVTNSSVQKLGKSFPKLKKLYLAGIKGLTISTLLSLGNEATHLQMLELSPDFSAEGKNTLRKHLPTVSIQFDQSNDYSEINEPKTAPDPPMKPVIKTPLAHPLQRVTKTEKNKK